MRSSSPGEVAAYTNSNSNAAGSSGPGSGATEHEREIAQLREALATADAAVREAREARRALAQRLSLLGEAVVVDPLCEAWIQVKMEQLRTEFEEEFEDFEGAGPYDLPGEAKWSITRVVRMMAALRDGCQFDREGYIAPDGRWVSFKPTDEEVRGIDWKELEDYWEF